jgi:ribose 5-phosphate isomerase RpiB
LALMIVDTWLKTECSMDERHLRRIEKIHLIERRKQEN